MVESVGRRTNIARFFVLFCFVCGFYFRKITGGSSGVVGFFSLSTADSLRY